MTPVGVSNKPKNDTLKNLSYFSGHYVCLKYHSNFLMDTVMMNEHCQFTKLVTLYEAHALCLAQQF